MAKYRSKTAPAYHNTVKQDVAIANRTACSCLVLGFNQLKGLMPLLGVIATFLLQTAYAYFHSAWCGELQKLTEVAKNCKIDTLCGFKVIRDHQIWHQSKGHMQLPISGY